MIRHYFLAKLLSRGAKLGALTGSVFSLAIFCCAVLSMVFMTLSPVLKQAIFFASIGLPLLLGTALGTLICSRKGC